MKIPCGLLLGLIASTLAWGAGEQTEVNLREYLTVEPSFDWQTDPEALAHLLFGENIGIGDRGIYAKKGDFDLFDQVQVAWVGRVVEAPPTLRRSSPRMIAVTFGPDDVGCIYVYGPQWEEMISELELDIRIVVKLIIDGNPLAVRTPEGEPFITVNSTQLEIHPI